MDTGLYLRCERCGAILGCWIAGLLVVRRKRSK